MVAGFHPVETNNWELPVFRKIGEQWMIITAMDGKGGFNGMTASWGGMGILWGKPVCFLFVRPQRHTYSFMEQGDCVTLSFFSEQYRSALRYFGTHSGRDGDKCAATGLTPMEVSAGNYAYGEAQTVVVARKLYGQDMVPECFTDREPDEKNYHGNDYHRMYICEITAVWERD